MADVGITSSKRKREIWARAKGRGRPKNPEYRQGPPLPPSCRETRVPSFKVADETVISSTISRTSCAKATLPTAYYLAIASHPPSRLTPSPPALRKSHSFYKKKKNFACGSSASRSRWASRSSQNLTFLNPNSSHSLSRHCPLVSRSILFFFLHQSLDQHRTERPLTPSGATRHPSSAAPEICSTSPDTPHFNPNFSPSTAQMPRPSPHCPPLVTCLSWVSDPCYPQPHAHHAA